MCWEIIGKELDLSGSLELSDGAMKAIVEKAGNLSHFSARGCPMITVLNVNFVVIKYKGYCSSTNLHKMSKIKVFKFVWMSVTYRCLYKSNWREPQIFRAFRYLWVEKCDT